jgi:hypothetical protein
MPTPRHWFDQASTVWRFCPVFGVEELIAESDCDQDTPALHHTSCILYRSMIDLIRAKILFRTEVRTIRAAVHPPHDPPKRHASVTTALPAFRRTGTISSFALLLPASQLGIICSTPLDLPSCPPVRRSIAALFVHSHKRPPHSHFLYSGTSLHHTRFLRLPGLPKPGAPAP